MQENFWKIGRWKYYQLQGFLENAFCAEQSALLLVSSLLSLFYFILFYFILFYFYFIQKKIFNCLTSIPSDNGEI